MRSLSRTLCFVPCLALSVTGCALDADRAVAPNAKNERVLLAMGGGGCAYLAVTSGILPPINSDNSSVFKLGRTIPVMIRVTDCATQGALNSLAPQISLVSVDANGDVPVNELESSSAADEGTQMRNAGEGKYMFNLSTKNSQFNAGSDLVAGTYRLTISSQDFAPVVVQFVLRP